VLHNVGKLQVQYADVMLLVRSFSVPHICTKKHAWTRTW